LLPTGELLDVTLVSKSGDPVLDQSALQAARSIKNYPVPKDSRTFDKYFRQFSLVFKPQN
jgi:colicin import membrane protein